MFIGQDKSIDIFECYLLYFIIIVFIIVSLLFKFGLKYTNK